ncbi:uncharacterized protein [Temnothorax nylanderi]|uniref:uncharacterized protein n=1 Tax=Temnothorax nylanderi TaxID=102681 RepID=UPI003A8BBF65
MEHLDETERDLLERSNQIATLGEYLAWAQRCEEFIEQLEEDCRAKRPRLSIRETDNPGHRQSLVARIARLEGAKTLLQRRFVHIGGEYAAGTSSDDNAERLVWREIDTAFESRVLTGAVININHIEPQKFLKDAEVIVLDHMQNVMQRHASVKINTVFNGEFVTGEKRANKSINTRNSELFRSSDRSDLREWYKLHVIEPTLAKLEEFQERDSGWALSRILNLTVNVNKYNPLRAGCYINLPQEIKLKKAVINVQSMDNACFAWSVVAALYPVKDNNNRESSYPHYTTVLKLQDIEFPMTLKQIKHFERLNDVSINVYTVEGEKTPNVLPIRLTDRKREKHVLLCLHYFYTSEKLEAHTVDCWEINDCAIKLPSDNDKWLAFKNHSRKERLPYVAYADLECTLEKTDADPTTPTFRSQHHQVFSIGYYVRCSYAQANNRYMQSYDPLKPSSYLMYFDVNNLYGWAMCQPLPYANFRWVEDVSNFEFSTIALDSPTGYILEVDLEIMYTDTDSLIYHVKCEDVYKNMKRDIAKFDTSDYAIDNAYGIPLENKKVPGLMKDENNGAIMTEFVGLRAKMCLRDEIEMTRQQACIRSKLHEVYTVSETKIALSPYDDKRYIVPNSTDTLPWGHYQISPPKT